MKPTPASQAAVAELLPWIQRRYSVTFEEICRHGRMPVVIRAREALVYLLRESLRYHLSYPDIAAVMARTCHTTPLDQCWRFTERLKRKDADAAEVARYAEDLKRRWRAEMRRTR